MIPHLANLIAIYIILAVSLNLVVGFTGLFNLGHAAFFGIGAYTSALLALAGLPWPVALLGAIALAGLAGFLVGLPTLRLRGDYLAIATLGFGEIAKAVFRNWHDVTRGVMGLPGIPRPVLFGVTFDTAEKFLVLTVAGAVLTYLVVESLAHSPFGRVLKGIREDEIAVEALGKDAFRFKLQALTLGAALAGLGGSLFAHYIAFIDPTSFTINLTIFILLVVVFGGLGNNLGAILAVVVLVAFRESLRFAGLPVSIAAPLQQFLFALLLIGLMLFRPKGLIPERKPAP